MLRRKFKIKHLNRIYTIADLTVEQYFLIAENPEEWLTDVFLEFNKTIPTNLSQQQVDAILKMLFDFQETSKKKDSDQWWEQDRDVIVGHFMKVYKQQYSEILKMPIRIFLRLYKVVEYVTGAKEYVSKGGQKPDKKAIRQALQNNKQVEWHK